MRLPRWSKRRPLRSAGEPRSRPRRPRAPAAARGRRAPGGRRLAPPAPERAPPTIRRLSAATPPAAEAPLPDKEAFLEQGGEPPHPKAPPADGPAVRQPPRLAANSPAIE